MYSIISIAIILSFYTTLDLFLTKKKRGAFVRQGTIIFVNFLPAVLNALILIEHDISKLWMKYFYPTYALGIIVVFILIILFIYMPLVSQFKRNKDAKSYTFLCLLFSGYKEFKNEIDIEKDKLRQLELSKEQSIKNICDDLHEFVPSFIDNVYNILEETDLDGFIVSVLTEFVAKFFSESSARFTLRILDEKKKNMISMITTRDGTPPGPIKIKAKNMISESMKEARPLIYSRNQKNHFRTNRNSVMNGVFDDYVSSCIIKTADGKPCVSICLDVKGERAVTKMHALVDSLFFSTICTAIERKYILASRRL